MFTAALLSEFYKLHSDHPLGWLGELDLTNVGGPLLRYTNEREDIQFHGITYASVPFFIDEFGEGTVDSPIELSVLVGNANLLVSSLKEQYWRGQLHPKWITRLWLVDMTAPNTTPLSHHAIHRVKRIDITYNSEAGTDVGQLTLYNDTVSATRNMRMDRYIPPRFPGMRFT